MFFATCHGLYFRGSTYLRSVALSTQCVRGGVPRTRPLLEHMSICERYLKHMHEDPLNYVSGVMFRLTQCGFMKWCFPHDYPVQIDRGFE